jgi:large subunit ribosomal protein LP0
MADEGGRIYSEKKVQYAERLEGLLATLPKVLLISADNVGSQQMHIVRAELRKDGQKAEIIMGKNTMIKFIIRRAAAAKPALNKLADAIRLNVGLVFTDADPKKIREILEKNKVVAGAKAGAIAPVNVFLEAGPTGMEPAQTGFFQALGIATKITKGNIEVIKQFPLAKVGEKVGASEAILMTKMGMKPFMYGLKVTHVFDGEGMIDPAILDIDDEDIKACFKEAMGRVAAVGLKIGYPVAPAVPHMFVNAFRNLVALSLETGISFKEAEDIKDRIANPDKYGGGGGGGGAAPAAAAAPAKAAAAKAPEPEEEEDMGFSLFD